MNTRRAFRVSLKFTRSTPAESILFQLGENLANAIESNQAERMLLKGDPTLLVDIKAYALVGRVENCRDRVNCLRCCLFTMHSILTMTRLLHSTFLSGCYQRRSWSRHEPGCWCREQKIKRSHSSPHSTTSSPRNRGREPKPCCTCQASQQQLSTRWSSRQH